MHFWQSEYCFLENICRNPLVIFQLGCLFTIELQELFIYSRIELFSHKGCANIFNHSIDYLFTSSWSSLKHKRFSFYDYQFIHVFFDQVCSWCYSKKITKIYSYFLLRVLSF
jgi:hypothetical protein